jgi:hypothetical protein
MIVSCVLYGPVEVSATDLSHIQRCPTECDVSECDQGTSQRRPGPNRAVES